MEQTRKLKHDMKNHVMCIEAIIENNEIEKAVLEKYHSLTYIFYLALTYL